MSRIDIKDSDQASGFGTSGYRGSFEREAEMAGLMTLNHDRRGSQNMTGYPSSGLPYNRGPIRPSGQKEWDNGNPSAGESALGPNRNNPALQSPPLPISTINHHLHLYRSPPTPQTLATSTEQGTFYQSSPHDRDNPFRHWQSPGPNSPSSLNHSRTTLLWSNIEPWMDDEYAKQVCVLMGWDSVTVKVPRPPPDPTTGQQANNPGYCFLTFPTPAHAASVLTQMTAHGKAGPITMPNSAKPFQLKWAPNLLSPASVTSSTPAYTGNSQPYQKEYSIFVGDLAPETSNSDLVAVFRNPVLGLRNDREPKFIRPFLSCKSAKIMLDPVTGVSRGYGFVRFTDEADQQRALIEMHGLYCLSRPMRISPATAKFKSAAPVPGEFTHGHFNAPVPGIENQQANIALSLPTTAQPNSVSAPIAATNSTSSIGSNSIAGTSTSSLGGSSSSGSLSSNTPSSTAHGFQNHDTKLSNGTGVPSLLSEAQLRQLLGQTDGYLFNEESWKHHAQARAILGNLIGPNGEQLTSTDPYNTTVFVGGLSPLISEDTLRTFFAPFGDIHYVKVPVGKHCGFVQFVRKADAERAIEKMQGFPIGGSRIRLSWGRSQYKAAQAAAQAAQAAALQAHQSTSTLPTGSGMTPEQAIQLLKKLTEQGYLMPAPAASPTTADGNTGDAKSNSDAFSSSVTAALASDPSLRPGPDSSQSVDTFASNGFAARPEIQRALPTFAPFSPDLGTYPEEAKVRETAFVHSDALPHPSKAFAPGFYPPQLQTQDLKSSSGSMAAGNGKISPSARPQSATRYNPHLEASDRANGRQEPISRPSSGQTSANRLDPDADMPDNGTLQILRLWGAQDSS